MLRRKFGVIVAVASLSISAAAFAQSKNDAGGVISSEALAAQNAQAKKNAKAAKTDGVFSESYWQMNYDWGCDGVDGTVTITVNDDHTFVSSSGAYGTWEKDKKKIAFTYSVGTVYSGVLSKDNQSASGTSVTPDGYTGCWTSTRL